MGGENEMARDLLAIGLRVRAERTRTGMSEAALAKAASVSQATVSRVESGAVATIQLVAAWRLADALGVRREWLLSGKGAKS